MLFLHVVPVTRFHIPLLIAQVFARGIGPLKPAVKDMQKPVQEDVHLCVPKSVSMGYARLLTSASAILDTVVRRAVCLALMENGDLVVRKFVRAKMGRSAILLMVIARALQVGKVEFVLIAVQMGYLGKDVVRNVDARTMASVTTSVEPANVRQASKDHFVVKDVPKVPMGRNVLRNVLAKMVAPATTFRESAFVLQAGWVRSVRILVLLAALATTVQTTVSASIVHHAIT